MYRNIGRKIKGLAKAIFIIEAFAAGVGAIATMMVAIAGGHVEVFIVGFLVAALVVLIAWISSWFMYGFGELIENSSILTGKVQYGRQNEMR